MWPAHTSQRPEPAEEREDDCGNNEPSDHFTEKTEDSSLRTKADLSFNRFCDAVLWTRSKLATTTSGCETAENLL